MTVCVPVIVVCQGEPFDGTAIDMGVGGMFIETAAEVEFEARVEIALRLPAVGSVLRLPGIVRWLKPGGIGVHFLELGALETYAVVSLLEAAMKGDARSFD